MKQNQIKSSTKLSDVAIVFNGKTPSKAQQREEGFPVLKIVDVTDDRKFKGKFNSFVESSVAQKSKAKFLKLDDTLILNAAHNASYVGSKQYRAEKEVVGVLPTGEWLIVRSKSNDLDPVYLSYWLRDKSTRFKMSNLVKGIHLYPKDVARLEIPLPPLPEQKKIVEILDAADALRQKDQQLIEHYDQLSQSLFLDMFGDPILNDKDWPNKKLGELCGVGSSKRVYVKDLKNKGVPFYRGQEVSQLSSGDEITPSLFITKEHFEKLKTHSGVPKIGDLLLPSICPDGRIYMVTNDKPFYFKDGRVLWIKVDQEKVNSTYLKFLLKVVFYANYSNIASGTTFAELKIVNLKKIDILCPPLNIQRQFEERVKSIESQLQDAKKILKKSNDLFNCLLQKAFTGELTQLL